MNKNFGEYLTRKREERELSINQLALYSGVSNAQISRIEKGLRKAPKPETIEKLAEALKVNYEEMMEAAGYIKEENKNSESPEWATNKDLRDLKKLLEQDAPIMFDGVPIDGEQRQRVVDVLTGLFWEAKEMNKKTYGRKKNNKKHTSESQDNIE